MQAVVSVAAKAIAGLTWKAVGTWAIKTTLLTAASYGIGRLVQQKQKGLTGASSSIKLDNTRDILQAGRIIYGRDRVGCCQRLRHTKKIGGVEYLYLILVWAVHECDAIEELRYGDEVVEFDGSGNATGTWAGILRCTHHLGASDQPADANFVAEIGDVWTEDHRLRGRCYSAIRVKGDLNKLGGGLQPFTAVIRGRKVHDERDESQDANDPSTWLWSANPPLCLGDYARGVPMLDGADELIRPLGLRLDESRVNAAIRDASANGCDEAVPLAAGGTEPRYEAHGSFDCDSDHGSVVAGLESSMAGRTLVIGGEIHIRAGIWWAPDFDVTEDMIRKGPRRTRNPLSRREKFNLITATINNPAANYQRTQVPHVKSDTFIAEDQAEFQRHMDLAFTASEPMAQRLMRLAMLRSRQGLMYQQPCNHMVLPALTGETVRITRARLGFTNKHFELHKMVVSMQPGDRGGIGVVADITTQETSATIYDWNTSLEQPVDPAPNTDLPNPRSVPTPTGLTLLSNNTTGRMEGDGNYKPRILATWDEAGSAFVTSGGKDELQYKRNADSIWLPVGADIPGDATAFYIADVLSTVAYDVRLRFINAAGVAGAWASVLNYPVPGDQTEPGVPTGFSMVAVPDGVRFICTAPADKDVTTIEYYYNTTGTAPVDATAALLSDGCKPSTKVETPLGGLTAGVLIYGWARAKDGSGNTSDWTSVQSATPTAASGYVLTQLNGKNRNWYQTTAPAAGMIENDLWFDTDDQFKVYRYNGSAWVSSQDGRIPTLESGLSSEIATRAADDYAETLSRVAGDAGLSAAVSAEASTRAYETGQLAAEYVLKVVAGNRVAGFRITNFGGGGGSSDFTIQASTFRIVNDSGAYNTVPFLVDGSGVYIDKAIIREVNAGAILAGTITAALDINAPFINGGIVRAARLDFGPLLGAGGPGLSAVMDWEHNGGANWRTDIDDSTAQWRVFNSNGTYDIHLGTGSFPLGEVKIWGNLEVTGYGFGDFTTYSDRSLKKYIKPMRLAMPLVRRMALKEYRLKVDAPIRANQADLGLIADDLALILPEAVHYSKAGIAGIRQSPIQALALKALQEVDVRQDESDFRHDAAEARIQALEDALAKLSTKS